jgi:hypothetical protein
MSLIVHDLINASYYAAMNARAEAVYSCPQDGKAFSENRDLRSVARKQGAGHTMTKRKSSNAVSPGQFIEKVPSDGIMSITAAEVRSRLTSKPYTELAQRRLKIFLQIFSYFGRFFMSATPMK